MRMILRPSGNMALLVSLLLMPFAIIYASPIRPAPVIKQSPLLTLSPLLRPLLATSTPHILAIAPGPERTAVNSNDYSQINEPSETALPVEDRTPTHLVIPAIKLDTPVEPMGWHTEDRNGQPVNIWDVPDHFAAGWLKTSAPVGLAGNTVLDGHHNFLGKVFENLVDLEVGDLIMLYTASREYVYHVEQKLILKEAGQPVEVRQANADYIYPTADERLTLVTCWPPTGNSHRLIIIARPVSIDSSKPLR